MAGGQKVLLDILREARREGHDCILSVPSPGKLTEIALRERIPVHFISFKKTFYLHQAFQFARYLKKNRIDLVHSHDMVSGNILARMGAKIAGVPIISHIHTDNAFSRNFFIRSYQRRLDTLTSRFCVNVIAVSEYTKRSLIAQGYRENRILVIHNGIDIPEVPPRKTKSDILNELHLASNTEFIACVGRLCKIKGQEVLLNAFSEIAKRFPKTILLFLGEDLETAGAYQNHLKGLTTRLGIETSVRFLGHQDDVRSYLKASLFLVLPSFLEGLPVVVLEAMSVGKAAIASDAGGTSELLLDEKTGFLVPPGNSEVLARKMEELLLHPEERARMGSEGYQRVKSHFSKQKMLQQVTRLYDFL